MNTDAENPKHPTEASRKSKPWGFVLIGLLLFSLWLATPYLLGLIYGDMAKQGQFGDMFGAVNALFSGFALLGAIYAIRIQSMELELQREEMIQSRQELIKQNQILSERQDTLRDEMKRNTEPLFEGILIGSGDSQGNIIHVANLGATVVNVSCELNPVVEGYTMNFAPIRSDPTEPPRWRIVLTMSGETARLHAGSRPQLRFRFSYVSTLRRRCDQWYLLEKGSKKLVPE